ncbi:MAG: hypothetical protein GYB65_18555 [Chloroflexi bacterium]|nr:hypothetical protein [Chloroflexota bacterium]
MSTYTDFLPYGRTDLEANRRGHLSERQLTQLQELHTPLPRAGVVLTGLLAGVLGVMFVVMLLVVDASQRETLLLTGLPMLAVVLVLVFLAANWYMGRTLSVLGAGLVRQITGSAHLESTTVQGAPEYYLQVAKKRFMVSRPLHDRLHEGQPITVYFIQLPAATYIMSVDEGD